MHQYCCEQCGREFNGWLTYVHLQSATYRVARALRICPHCRDTLEAILDCGTIATKLLRATHQLRLPVQLAG